MKMRLRPEASAGGDEPAIEYLPFNLQRDIINSCSDRKPISIADWKQLTKTWHKDRAAVDGDARLDKLLPVPRRRWAVICAAANRKKGR